MAGQPGAMQAHISERMKAPQLSLYSLLNVPESGGRRPMRMLILAVPYSTQWGVTKMPQYSPSVCASISTPLSSRAISQSSWMSRSSLGIGSPLRSCV